MPPLPHITCLILVILLLCNSTNGIFLPFGNMTTDDASLDNSYGCLYTASFGYSIVQPNVPIGGKIVDIFEVCVEGFAYTYPGNMEEAVFFAPIFTFSVIFQNAAVWAREDTSAPILNTLTNIISSRRHPGFEAQWSMIVTWQEMPFFFGCNGAPLCPTNTYQLVIVTDYVTSYALYNYGELHFSGEGFIGALITIGRLDKFYEQQPPPREGDEVLLMGQNGTKFESNADVPGTWIFNASSTDFYDVCMTTSPCGPPPNRCINEVGPFVWSCKCGTGFMLADGNFNYDQCLDIDECGDNPCGPSDTCLNTYGSYTCQCGAGYVPHPSIINLCIDDDECLGSPCTSQETCRNTEGSFICDCAEGYTGISGSCTDVNECNVYICNTEQNTVCANNVGGFSCDCRPGFTPIVNGTGCEDDPECDTNPCTELNYQCVETPGSYMCVCADGFIPEDGGTGRCIADYECVDQTVGYILDSAGREYSVVNTDISPVPSVFKLAMVSDACRIVDVNITRPGTGSQSQYQIVPFFSHPSEFITISSSSAIPLGDGLNRTSLLKTNEDISIHAYYETSSMITAFLLYPVDVLAKVYLLNIPLLERGVGHETDIIISSLEFRTQVTIRLPLGVTQSTLRRGKRAIGSGGSISVNMQPYTTHRFGVEDLDLSGGQLVASQKIAVFVTVVDKLTGQTTSHQVPPQNTLGKTFMMTEHHEKVRIVSTQPNTELVYDGLPRYIASAGDVYIVEGYIGLITADKPVSAMAVTGQSSGLTDEEILFPLESVIIDQYTFSTLEPSVAGDVALTLVVVTHSAFHGDIRLNGLPLIDYDPDLEWVAQPGSSFCYAKVHGLVAGVYTLTHPAPEVGFIATLYAHSRLTNDTIYSYPIGASLRDLTCTPTSTSVADRRDNDCDGRVDEEVCLDGEDFDNDGVGNEDCESVLHSAQSDLQPDPEMLSKTCCHGETCHLTCPAGQTLRIVQSHYGRWNYIDEKTCHVEVDEMLACGLVDSNEVFEDRCDDLRSCMVDITTENFRLSTNCTLRSLYAVVEYMCLEPAELECTIPAVRNVKAWHGREDEQFIASNPPEHPAYAGYEVLSHHGNIGNGAHTDYTYLHSLGEPAIACRPEYADTRYGLEEWCADETKAFGAYIQVYIDGPYRVTNVVLQGSRTEEYWVTHFSLEYSADEKAQIWRTVTDNLGNKKIFPGNTNARHTVLVPLREYSFTARYVRLTIEGYHRYPSLHVDFLRCMSVDGCQHISIDKSNMIMQPAARLESYIATCFDGYMTPQETKSFYITCSRFGSWDGVESCQEVQCGPFRTPTSMAGLPPQALPFLTDFRYLGMSGSQSCPSDSDLVGITQIKCNSYANVTVIPVCQIRNRDQCSFPTVQNAIVNVVTANVGSKAIYDCLPGFDLVTPTSTLTCLPGGNLDGPTPVCQSL